MQKFNSQRINVLVCTDVASRGLDIKGISHVYNYDAPKDSKDYVHRIGRTARAGALGKVVNIVASRDYENFGKIMEAKEFNIPKGETPEVERIFINTGTSGNRGRFDNNRSRSFGNSPRNNYSRGDNRGGRNFDNKVGHFGPRRGFNRGSEDRPQDSKKEDWEFGHFNRNRNSSGGNRNFGNRDSGKDFSRRNNNHISGNRNRSSSRDSRGSRNFVKR
jgi:superfamily II DNA/RNA helicase